MAPPLSVRCIVFMKTVFKWVLALAFSPWAHAGVVDISASYMPSSLNPGHVRFTNTTPLSGYCADWPGQCLPGTFSISLPVTLDRTWVLPGSPEELNYQRVDGGWNTLTVQNTESGDRVPVRFRFSILSRRYVLGALQPGGIAGQIGTIANIWAPISGGCVQGVGSGSATVYEFGWSVPEGTALCVRAPATLERLGPYAGSIDKVSIGYELETPDPLAMSNGFYTGEAQYTVGHGKQIDLGSGAYSDSIIHLNFALTVLHELRMDFAPGSDRAVLEPQGGWADWLNRGRAPTRLYQEHPFRLWTSAPMSVYLRCNDYQIGHQCAIQREGSTEQVPINVALTFPGNIRYHGNEVREFSLPVGAAAAVRFVSVAPTFDQPGKLHYSVDKDSVATMLKQAGSTWRGDVTIVFDAQM